MSHVRKKLRKQIEELDKSLHFLHTRVLTQQALIEEKINPGYLWLVVLIPAVLVGWKMSKEKWVSKWTIHLSELLTFAFANYLRRQVFKLIR